MMEDQKIKTTQESQQDDKDTKEQTDMTVDDKNLEQVSGGVITSANFAPESTLA